MQRWCVAYRPDNLMMVNTNNGIERLNVGLKYDKLVEYKNCILCDLVNVVIDSLLLNFMKGVLI